MINSVEQTEISQGALLAMIAGQIRPNRVADERTVEAIGAVPRELFVPKSLRGVAYIDEDLEVAPGRFLLEPMVFARLVMEAAILPADAVLDIGCASGWSSAVLAQLADAVVAVEEDEALAGQATARLAELGVDNAVVLTAPLVAGAPEQGPFEVIFLNGAVEAIPDALTEQLAEGGRLVCVRRHAGRSEGWLMIKTNGVVGGRPLFDAFVPLLPGFAAPQRFEF